MDEEVEIGLYLTHSEPPVCVLSVIDGAVWAIRLADGVAFCIVPCREKPTVV